MPVGYSSLLEPTSLFPLSLDWLIENRPDLLPSVDIGGQAPWSVHQETAWDERLDLIGELLSQLTPDRQALIHALYVRGMSQRQYATIKGVSEAAVRGQKRRTIKTLKRLLHERGDTQGTSAG